MQSLVGVGLRREQLCSRADLTSPSALRPLKVSALPFISFGPLFSLSKTCSAWLRAHDPWGMMGLRARPHLLTVPTLSIPQEPLDCDMAAPVSSKPFKPQ